MTLPSTFLRGRERLLRSLGYLLEGRGEQTTLDAGSSGFMFCCTPLVQMFGHVSCYEDVIKDLTSRNSEALPKPYRLYGSLIPALAAC